MQLSLTPAHEQFRASIQAFARDFVAPEAAIIDAEGDFPFDLLRAAASRGLMGATLPAEWGGAALDYLSYSLAIEAIATASATVAVSLVVHNSLVTEVVAHAGTPDQKTRWLKKLTTGEAIGAFALSEQDAGTDAANQQTRAVKTADGYVIKGRKIWVANAEGAGLILLFANTTPGARGNGITAFLVRHTPGRPHRRADSLGVGLAADLDFNSPGADQGGSSRDSSSRVGAAGDAWALPRRRSIGAAAVDEAIRSRKNGRRSRRSRNSRPSSGCWPTSRPSSMRRNADMEPPGGSPEQAWSLVDGEAAASRLRTKRLIARQ
jgi:hypothetical protein